MFYNRIWAELYNVKNWFSKLKIYSIIPIVKSVDYGQKILKMSELIIIVRWKRNTYQEITTIQ